jgi:hypothetical protein
MNRAVQRPAKTSPLARELFDERQLRSGVEVRTKNRQFIAILAG